MARRSESILILGLGGVGYYLVPDPKWPFAPPSTPIPSLSPADHAGIKSISA